MNILNKENHRYVEYGIQCFNGAIQGLVTGDLTQQRLTLLVERRGNLLALHKKLRMQGFVNKDQVPESGIESIDPEQVLVKIIEWRKAEYQAFRNQMKMIQDAKTFISQSDIGNAHSLDFNVPVGVLCATGFSCALCDVVYRYL